MTIRSAMRLLRAASFLVFHSAVLRIQAAMTQPERRPSLRAERQRWACSHVCRVIGIDVHVNGNGQRDEACLIVSNHLGPLDTMILASVFPVAFVAKAEILGWPLIGWVCRGVGVIPAHRASRMSSRDLVERIRERLAGGVSVLVFPEGTTSDGSTVAPFKTGAFEAVGGNGSPVLPVSIRTATVDGADARDPEINRLAWADPTVPFSRHVWEVLGVRRAEVVISVGNPIPAYDSDRRTLAAEAHAAVLALYEGSTKWPVAVSDDTAV